ATAAALGVLTPMPCVPVTTTPWVPGSPKLINGGMPAVDSNCKLICNWGGVIQVLNPGQTAVIVG
ncbi:MAG TPA: PAAR-like protein, partial [Kofleriaceae bacterium]|nr:PAAR-like protein [Kofleriaceae bacterium]